MTIHSSSHDHEMQNIESPKFPSNQLSWTEKWALQWIIRFNRPGWIHRFGVWWGTNIPQRFFAYVTRHRWQVHQTEYLDAIDRNANILMISNHKSFFDLFVATTILRSITDQNLGKPCVFPVRSPFFYDNILGVLINFIGSGCCMYPPVFRDERKQVLNPHGIQIMQWLLRHPKLCLGLHPEGRRSKGQDPYVIEPARKGVGVLIQNAKPDMVILPLFITGLSNDPVYEFKQTFRKQEATPIKLIWGEARLASEYKGEVEEIIQQVHQQLQILATQAKKLDNQN
jgi:1-acyl-sn-glycerol-3-phosphate acyltransferase